MLKFVVYGGLILGGLYLAQIVRQARINMVMSSKMNFKATTDHLGKPDHVHLETGDSPDCGPNSQIVKYHYRGIPPKDKFSIDVTVGFREAGQQCSFKKVVN